MIDMICSWCGEFWSKPGGVEGNLPSHGMCFKCAAEYRSNIYRQRRERDPLSNDINKIGML